MEFLLQVGKTTKTVNSTEVSVVDTFGKAITLMLDEREINMIEGQRIQIADPLVEGNELYLRLITVKEDGAIFDLRRKIEKRKKKQAKRIESIEKPAGH